MSGSLMLTSPRPSDYAEIIGRVQEDGSLREETMAFLPPGSFDLDTYNEVVKLSNGKFSSLFV